MFKTIKWYAMTCTVMILLVDKMAQAGFPDKKKPLLPANVETTSQPVQGASHHVATGSNAGTIASQTNRSTIVNKLDKMAVRWDFSNFNFGGLHRYFVGHISNSAFIEATLLSRYACISSLAQALVDSHHCTITTLDEAKFFVYSALKSLHDRCVEYGRQQMVGFHFLRQANEAMRLYQMDSVVYNESKLAPDDAKTMLSVYPHSFTSNDHITGLLLANRLSNLISVINTYAEVSQKYEAPISLVQAEKQPTVAELLQYFPDDHERVLAFLVYFPMETEMAGDDNSQPMSAETALKQQVSESLIKLWDAAVTDDTEREQVAGIALYLFYINPLAFVCHKSSVVHSGPDSSTDMCKSALLVFCSEYIRLQYTLPMDDYIFRSDLLTNKLMDGKLWDTLNRSSVMEMERSRLFVQSIREELLKGNGTKFIKLLAFMITSELPDLSYVGKDICTQLGVTDQQLLELFPGFIRCKTISYAK